MLPVLIMTIVTGLFVTYRRLKNKGLFWQWSFIIVVTGAYVWGAIYFAWRYFLFYPEDAAGSWQAGHQEMVQKVNHYQDQFERIVVTTNYGQPHIFFAFFTPFDPAWYQQEVNLSDQQEIFNARIPHLGKLQFRQIQTTDFCLPNTLIVTQKRIIDKTLPRLTEITFPHRFRDDPIIFEFFDTNNPQIKQEFCSQDKTYQP